MILWLLVALAQQETIEPLGRFQLAYESEYVGSESCRACHGELAEQQRTHHMARTGRMAAPDDPLFSDESVRAPIQWGARAEAPAEPPNREMVAAILGSGVHGVTPIAAEPGRRIRELGLSYSDVLGTWFPTPGTENNDDASGSLKTVEESASCLGCHATTILWRDDMMVPSESSLGIQCERCHGPGSAHIEAVTRDEGALQIMNPGTLSPDAQVRFCAECHRTPADVEPLELLGQAPSLARHAGAGLMMSACFRRSPPDETLSCTSCHSPHRNIQEEDGSRFRAVCLSCHQEPSAEHQYESVTDSSDCIACHMPAEEQGFHGMSFSDHWIRVPGSSPPLTEANDSVRDDALDYLEILYRNAWEEPQVGEERRARLALGLAEVLFGQNRHDDALDWARESLSHAPMMQHRLKAAAMFREGGELLEATRVLDEIVSEDAELVRAHFDLGELARQQRDYEQALVHYGRALELRPDFAEGHTSTAAVYRQLDRLGDALAHYRLAEELTPGDPLVAEGIAWVLATSDDPELRDPARAVQLGERLAAETQYRHPVVLDTLAAAYAANGDFETALRAAKRAAEIAQSGGAENLARTIRARIAIYEEGKPFVISER